MIKICTGLLILCLLAVVSIIDPAGNDTSYSINKTGTVLTKEPVRDMYGHIPESNKLYSETIGLRKQKL